MVKSYLNARLLAPVLRDLLPVPLYRHVLHLPQPAAVRLAQLTGWVHVPATSAITQDLAPVLAPAPAPAPVLTPIPAPAPSHATAHSPFYSFGQSLQGFCHVWKKARGGQLF